MVNNNPIKDLNSHALKHTFKKKVRAQCGSTGWNPALGRLIQEHDYKPQPTYTSSDNVNNKDQNKQNQITPKSKQKVLKIRKL